jgi:hypothetical protein
MRIKTKAIREGRTLYLLEDVNVPEGQQLVVTIEASSADEADDESTAPQETLADVLGFDPADEERLKAEGNRQRKDLLNMATSTKAASEPPHDGSSNHDKYLYGNE